MRQRADQLGSRTGRDTCYSLSDQQHFICRRAVALTEGSCCSFNFTVALEPGALTGRRRSALDIQRCDLFGTGRHRPLHNGIS
jgi:hypothetical protein